MEAPAGRATDVERVLRQISTGTSVLVTGPLGVGKTELLRCVTDALRADGTTVTEIAANAASSNIPFGALTGFVDPNDRVAPAALIAAATDRVGRLAATGRSVLFIDDAQHLDVSTIAVVHRVVTTTDTVLMASIRSSDPAPDELRELWRHANVDRVELDPLDPDTTRSVVAAALDTGTTDTDVESIATRSAGNPLFARELVRAYLDGTPTGLTPQLVDLVDQRISGLTPVEQEHLTVIAVGQPLDVALDIVDVDVVASLESAGLVTTEAVNGDVVARPAHPLHSEVIRTRLTPIARRALSERLGAALLAQPARRRGDALRVVTWLIDAGDRPPPALSEAAAFEAIGWSDTELADRLASMAVEDDRTAASLFALGEIRRLSGRREDAATIWEEAFEIATDDDDIRRVALSLGQLYQLFLRRASAALDVLHTALERITDPAMRLGIEADIALNEWTGDRRDSIAEIVALLDDPNCGDESAWTALSDLLWVKMTALDLDDIDRHVARARDIEQRLPADRDGELDLINAVISNVELARHGPDAAIAAGTAFQNSADAAGIACGVTMFTTSQMLQLRGDLRSSLATAESSIAALDVYDTFNASPMTHWHASIIAHHLGDDERGRQLLTEANRRAGGDAPWQTVWLPRAQAWEAIAHDDVAAAVRFAHDAGKGSVDSSEIGWGVYCYHDAVVWGAADEVVDALRRVRPHTSNVSFFELVFDHVEAAAERSPGALAHVARRFEEVNARWYAAAAWANRAACIDDEIEACRDATRALTLSPHRGLHPGTDALALSGRQLDVAMAIAAGATSREAADQLFLSPRTVDNHLRGVYRKLGIAGRNELPDVIAEPLSVRVE